MASPVAELRHSGATEMNEAYLTYLYFYRQPHPERKNLSV